MNSLSTSRSTQRRPNVLLIVMDAVRAKHLSCYGYHRPTTPNLERFADQCVTYETAISAAGWSLPSHASIFTGQYPSKHGAHDQYKYLTSDYPTMAEILRWYGYRTLAFCYNAYVSSATGLNRGFDQFNSDSRNIPVFLRKVVDKAANGIAKLSKQNDSGARQTNKKVYSALRDLQGESQPFFMFLHYEEPHAPYQPPQKYNCYLPNGVSVQQAKEINQDQWAYFVNPSSMNEQDFEILKALYDAEITYTDRRISEVLHWLEEFGMLDQTLIIITADHGENVGDHQMMGHAYCLYDTLLHVPLIIHYPYKMVRAERIQHQVQTVDLLPTVLATLGDTSSEIYRSLQGYNLLSSTKREFTIAEQANPDLTTFYQRFPEVDVSHYDRALKAIRTDQYKYIWTSNGQHELYDLQADSDEQHNIVNKHRDVARDLDQRLTEWQTGFETAAPSEEPPEFDEAVKERLRALGYLE